MGCGSSNNTVAIPSGQGKETVPAASKPKPKAAFDTIPDDGSAKRPEPSEKPKDAPQRKNSSQSDSSKKASPRTASAEPQLIAAVTQPSTPSTKSDGNGASNQSSGSKDSKVQQQENIPTQLPGAVGESTPVKAPKPAASAPPPAATTPAKPAGQPAKVESTLKKDGTPVKATAEVKTEVKVDAAPSKIDEKAAPKPDEATAAGSEASDATTATPVKVVKQTPYRQRNEEHLNVLREQNTNRIPMFIPWERPALGKKAPMPTAADGQATTATATTTTADGSSQPAASDVIAPLDAAPAKPKRVKRPDFERLASKQPKRSKKPGADKENTDKEQAGDASSTPATESKETVKDAVSPSETTSPTAAATSDPATPTKKRESIKDVAAPTAASSTTVSPLRKTGLPLNATTPSRTPLRAGTGTAGRLQLAPIQLGSRSGLPGIPTPLKLDKVKPHSDLMEQIRRDRALAAKHKKDGTAPDPMDNANFVMEKPAALGSSPAKKTVVAEASSS